jgi:putative ubiquitin-RnfH superfamily antitoxin RatB of RatAB toxin-antitoxin module
MSGTLQITVIYSPQPRQVFEVVLSMALGSKLADAVHTSGIPARYPDLNLLTSSVGIWGRKAAPGQALHDGDRVEIYRPLTVDPKVARRERFTKQGAKKAGLFTKRRAGAGAGY